MILKYKEFEVVAETQEEAIGKIIALATEKDKCEKQMESRFANLLIWWCLCDYFHKYEDPNNLLHHETTKLIGAFRDCSKIKFKKMNSEEMRKKTLQNIISNEKYLENQTNIISDFITKFDSEKIERNNNKYMDIANDFIKDIPTIISLIEKADSSKCINYVDSRFSK